MPKDRPQRRCREVLRIYTDESVPVAVAEGLRRRGIEAWSARDAGKLGMSDEEQVELRMPTKSRYFHSRRRLFENSPSMGKAGQGTLGRHLCSPTKNSASVSALGASFFTL